MTEVERQPTREKTTFGLSLKTLHFFLSLCSFSSPPKKTIAQREREEKTSVFGFFFVHNIFFLLIHPIFCCWKEFVTHRPPLLSGKNFLVVIVIEEK
jgi:hypothetical protein